MSRAPDVPRFTTARASHPRALRALNTLGRLWPGAARPLDPDAIWEAARTGDVADRDPTPEAGEALAVLLDDLAANVRLHPIGRFSALDDTVRLARTHLRLHATYDARPEVLETPLPDPIYIVGWPRTGSTFLHQLLAADPASRSIPYWESFDPVPPAPGAPDRRTERLDKMLGQLRKIAPSYDAIHPMTAEATEECVALFMNEFRTLQLDFQYRVPGYARWLLRQDGNVAYSLYERQLRLIQSVRPGGPRQVLKDPTHLVHLETLVARHRGARFVFTHRDPAEALSSIASLVAYTRALFTDDVDPHAIGAELVRGYWIEALARSRKVRAALPSRNAVDVRYEDLQRDPIATAERIYARLGLPFDEAARAGMTAFLETHARERAATGRHHHALADFGLTREAVRERLAEYCAEVGV